MPRITRRLEEPNLVGGLDPNRQPGPLAAALVEWHNAAVNQYGSDSGLFHAFCPETGVCAQVNDGSHGFLSGTVVSRLAWGRIDVAFAQRLLEADGYA
jgi:hypothetical protein